MCAIGEEKYSSLRKLLRITVCCLKFIRKRIWSRCSETLKAKILEKHPILKIINKTPRIGEVAIVKEDSVPRGMWKVGRIKELVLGGDGNVRTVGICSPNGRKYYRTVNHIFPLEVADQVDNSEEENSDQYSELQFEL